MNAITLHRPWPRLIFEHGKNIENRSWRPADKWVGCWLAIHAGEKVAGAGVARMMELLREKYAPERTSFGADFWNLVGPTGVIGVARLKGWFFHDDYRRSACGLQPADFYDYARSSWYVPGGFGWVLDKVTPLRSPIPCRGAQRVWRLPQEIDNEIRCQIPSVVGP